jgi:transcriptional regulator with XRE-family HTH domain
MNSAHRNGSWAQDILDGIPAEVLVFDDITHKVVSELHTFIEKSGISQRELASRLGVSEAHVSKTLSGDRNITLKTLAKILSAVGGELQVKIIGNHAHVQEEGDLTTEKILNAHKRVTEEFERRGLYDLRKKKSGYGLALFPSR